MEKIVNNKTSKHFLNKHLLTFMKAIVRLKYKKAIPKFASLLFFAF